MQTTITYAGFLQTIVRTFPTHERALQWLTQCGVAVHRVTFKEETP